MRSKTSDPKGRIQECLSLFASRYPVPENRKAGLLQGHLLLLHASISHHQQRSAGSVSGWLLLVEPREAILSAVRHQFVEPTCGAHKVQKIQRIQKNLLELLKIYYNTGFILRNCRIGRWEQCDAIKWSRLHTGLRQKYVLDYMPRNGMQKRDEIHLHKEEVLIFQSYELLHEHLFELMLYCLDPGSC